MKLTLGEALTMVQWLPKLLDKEIEITQAYWLSRATDQLQNELGAFEKARFKLIKKYGLKDDKVELIERKNDDGTTRYDITDKEAFQKDFDKIANIEIDIKYEPISTDEFKGTKIATEVLLGLGRLISAPKKEAKGEKAPKEK